VDVVLIAELCQQCCSGNTFQPLFTILLPLAAQQFWVPLIGGRRMTLADFSTLNALNIKQRSYDSKSLAALSFSDPDSRSLSRWLRRDPEGFENDIAVVA